MLTEKVVSPSPELNQWTYCLIVLSELFYLKSARTHKKDWQKSLNNRISFSDKWTKRKSNYFWKRRWHRLRTSSWTSSLFAKRSQVDQVSFSSSEAPLLIFGVDNHTRSYAASTPMQLWRVLRWEYLIDLVIESVASETEVLRSHSMVTFPQSQTGCC